jgi:tRNA A58 N-methylase Trm61
MQDAADNVKRHGLQEYVSFEKMDFTDWLADPTDFDIVHIDISNNGMLIRQVYKALRGRSGEVLFEGGTEERDQVEWMAKFDKEPIVGCGAEFEVIDARFPALSRMILR